MSLSFDMIKSSLIRMRGADVNIFVTGKLVCWNCSIDTSKEIVYFYRDECGLYVLNEFDFDLKKHLYFSVKPW